jgi:serine/threonine protein kinase
MIGSSAPEIDGLTYVRPLGSGGFCDVLLYEQDEPRMKVAVKVLAVPGLSVERRRQFTAEGNAMASLADHPFIVPVFRAGVTTDGQPFLVMQFYPEPNLAQRARHERIAVAEALRIGVQIAGAIETAHRSGILHRDVKPANVLGGPYGNPGLTDFGLAAVIAGPDAPVEGVSVPWAPPEVLLDSAPPDVRGDVYSLAATVWHLLSGRSPFERPGLDNSAAALRDRILIGEPTPTGRLDVPDSLDRLLRQAMAANPALRPSSALAFARGLQRVEQEQRLALTQIVVPSGPRLAEATTASSTRVQASIPRTAAPGPQPAPSPPAPAQPAPPSPPGPAPSAAASGAASVPADAPRYAQWPPPADDWSAPVLSSGPPPRSRPFDLWQVWAARRVDVLVAAAILIMVVIAAIVVALFR